MRKLKSWTDGYNKYMEGKGSPLLFTKWAGIYTIAAAMERKTWIVTAKGKLFPNLYVITVGPPGAGKTLATAVSRDFLEELKDHHIAPASLTKASLIDALNEAVRSFVRPADRENPITEFNSLAVVSDELGVLLPAYDSDFMNVLTNIYDCRVYAEKRRTNKLEIEILAPQINMLAATTPAYLNSMLPEGAWDQGFLSRTMLIYAGAGAPQSLFTFRKTDQELEKSLLEDLKEISKLFGKMSFSDESIQIIEEWHMAGGTPIPDHPKLTHYNTRRTGHLLKLAMVSCASTDDSLIISVDNVAEAMDWLLEAEAAIPDIFKSMKNGGDSRVMEELYHFMYTTYAKENRPIHESRLYSFLQERTPAHNVERMIKGAEMMGLIERKLAEVGSAYLPRTQRVH